MDPQSLLERYGQSLIDENGAYVAGQNGRARQFGERKAFAKRPSLPDAIQAHEGSRAFRESRLLGAQSFLTDGFRARFGKEVLLVDKERDPILRLALRNIDKRLAAANLAAGGEISLAVRLRLISVAVSDAFGGSAANSSDDLEDRLSEATAQVEYPADLLLGNLLGGALVAATRPGAGICRHRSILFKYVVDSLRLCHCALVDGVMVPNGRHEVGRMRHRGYQFDHMWNLVWLDGEPSLVDCMNRPGLLISGNDLATASNEYHRLGGRTGMVSLDVEDAQRLAGRREVSQLASLREEFADGDCAEEDDATHLDPARFLQLPSSAKSRQDERWTLVAAIFSSLELCEASCGRIRLPAWEWFFEALGADIDTHELQRFYNKFCHHRGCSPTEGFSMIDFFNLLEDENEDVGFYMNTGELQKIHHHLCKRSE